MMPCTRTHSIGTRRWANCNPTKISTGVYPDLGPSQAAADFGQAGYVVIGNGVRSGKGYRASTHLFSIGTNRLRRNSSN